MTRHNLSISDALWARVQQAAIREAVKQGRPISISEWIRESIRQRLEQEAARGGAC